MLKIFLSLLTFGLMVWLPIVVYELLNRKTPNQTSLQTKKAIPIAYQRFGKGSRSHFSEYLEGESRVPVKSIRDICEWLMGCEYVPDLTLFDHPDLWQHPLEFEARQKGDCEDHCLWAWRKLHDLGVDAEFVVGKIHLKNGSWGDHSWIQIKNGRVEHVFEATAKTMKNFIIPSSKATRLYRPRYAMDTQLNSHVYFQNKNH